jgi:DNA-binding CsgD family transcriptional regulator
MVDMPSLIERKEEAVRRYLKLHEQIGHQQRMMLKVQRQVIRSMPLIARFKVIREKRNVLKGMEEGEGRIFKGLSRRERQTLEWALRGDSEKQIAGKLKLSKHTVHLYVTAIYKHFDVHSRGELLAHCLGQGRVGRGK